MGYEYFLKWLYSLLQRFSTSHLIKCCLGVTVRTHWHSEITYSDSLVLLINNCYIYKDQNPIFTLFWWRSNLMTAKKSGLCHRGLKKQNILDPCKFRPGNPCSLKRWLNAPSKCVGNYNVIWYGITQRKGMGSERTRTQESKSPACWCAAATSRLDSPMAGWGEKAEEWGTKRTEIKKKREGGLKSHHLK